MNSCLSDWRQMEYRWAEHQVDSASRAAKATDDGLGHRDVIRGRPCPDAQALGTRPPHKEGPNAVGPLAVINGALAGAGSVYLTTHSVWIRYWPLSQRSSWAAST